MMLSTVSNMTSPSPSSNISRKSLPLGNSSSIWARPSPTTTSLIFFLLIWMWPTNLFETTSLARGVILSSLKMLSLSFLEQPTSSSTSSLRLMLWLRTSQSNLFSMHMESMASRNHQRQVDQKARPLLHPMLLIPQIMKSLERKTPIAIAGTIQSTRTIVIAVSILVILSTTASLTCQRKSRPGY